MPETKSKVGIEWIGVSAPKTYVESTELGKAIDMDSEKIRKGLGNEKIRLPSFSQGNITMNANLLYKFIKSIDSSDEERMKFFSNPPSRIYYATESNSDHSRPEVETALGMVYSKLLVDDEKRYRAYVEAFKHTIPMQQTFACAGGGAALLDALNSVYVRNGTSAIVITSDTAVYDPKKAKNAEATQGSAATLSWVTAEPKLIVIDPTMHNGAYNIPLQDFTKYGSPTPKVYGAFSEKVYVDVSANVLGQMEKDLSTSGVGMDFFVGHVPFPKQAIYFASALFEHHMKHVRPKEFEAMQSRESLGKDPLASSNLVELFDNVLSSARPKNYYELIRCIDENKEISEYWDWLKKLRKQPEFDEFVASLRINEALLLPSQIGNSYTSSQLVALVSLLINKNTDKEIRGVMQYYGSGAVGLGMLADIIATKAEISGNVLVDVGDEVALNAGQYRELHTALIRGDAERMLRKDGEILDLIEKDREFLGRLPTGFLVRSRLDDGTPDAVYSEADGRLIRLDPRM